jgi:hypothetical protein
VLSQLNPRASYDDLATEIRDLQGRLMSSLVLVDVARESSTVGAAPRRVVAGGWRDDLAVAVLPASHRIEASPSGDVRAVDRATGLALIHAAGHTSSFATTSPPPQRPQQARYLMATTATPAGISLRPTFIGALSAINGIAWPGEVWAVPSGTALELGSFLFETSGELVGIAVASGSGFAIVPAATVMAEAERLVGTPKRPAGTTGVDVQALTEGVAALTGAKVGVVVTWIRRDGPGWGTLVVGDVIEAVDGHELASREQWDARVARLVVGESLALRVRRRGQIRDLSIEAALLTTEVDEGRLGLEMRRRTAVGVEITRVQPASIAARAGLSAGDVITLFGDVQSPSPTQIARTFGSLRAGDRVLVAITRGETHHVTVLGR